MGERLAAIGLRLLLRALPAAVREEIEADLRESRPPTAPARAGQTWRLCHEVLAIAGHYQAECFRAHESRLQLSALLAACALLMFAVPPALNTALLGWARVQPGSGLASHATALLLALPPAAAAGLLLGLLGPTARHLAGSRRTVAAMLVLIAFSLHPWRPALAGVAALVFGLWLGQVRRRQGVDGSA